MQSTVRIGKPSALDETWSHATTVWSSSLCSQADLDPKTDALACIVYFGCGEERRARVCATLENNPSPLIPWRRIGHNPNHNPRALRDGVHDVSVWGAGGGGVPVLRQRGGGAAAPGALGSLPHTRCALAVAARHRRGQAACPRPRYQRGC